MAVKNRISASDALDDADIRAARVKHLVELAVKAIAEADRDPMTLLVIALEQCEQLKAALAGVRTKN